MTKTSKPSQSCANLIGYTIFDDCTDMSYIHLMTRQHGVRVMNSHRLGDNPLSEPLLIIYASPGAWVTNTKKLLIKSF